MPFNIHLIRVSPVSCRGPTPPQAVKEVEPSVQLQCFQEDLNALTNIGMVTLEVSVRRG